MSWSKPMDNRERDLRDALHALCLRLEAKVFPLTPHDTAEPCITLCDLQDECKALGEARAAIEGERPDTAMERLNEQWKARCLVLMGDKDKLKAEIERLRRERALEAAPCDEEKK